MRDPDTGAGTQRYSTLWAWGTFVLVLLVMVASARAQDATGVPWGKLSKTELRDRLADDPSASASVVFDRGLITVGPGFRFTFERHRRIQIFGPAAYSLANVEIVYRSSEKIDFLEGHTLTPDGRRVELRREHVYETKTGNLVTRVFTFPEVKPGCVIEYRYKISSRNFYYLRPWAFQSDIPTEYSELSVRLPEGFEYEAVLNNAELVDGPDSSSYYSVREKPMKIRQFTWRTRNLPPLVAEACVPSLLDYRAQLDFQIVRYRDGQKVWEFVDSWQDLAKQVRHIYKPLLQPDDHWPVWTVPGGDSAAGRMALARRIYRFVRDSIAQSGEVRAIAEGGLLSAREVLAQRRGNPLEKNLLLISLLRYHGFQAYPFLISRRNHLRFDRRDHRLDQFDHALAMLEIGNDRIFCDVNTPVAWMGYLPPEDQVAAGIVIGHRGLPDVVLDMPAPPVGNEMKGAATVTLHADGSAEGRLEATVSGQAAYVLLQSLADRDTAGYLQREWLPGVIPRTLTVERAPDDDWAPIRFVADFTWPQAAPVDDRRIFLRPSVLRKLTTNPLMTASRRYPISFDAPWTEDCKITWNLPEGFELNELPSGRELVGDGFVFHSSVVREGKQVVASRFWRVSKRDFPVNRFGELRRLFMTVQLSQRGLLVLYHGRS